MSKGSSLPENPLPSAPMQLSVPVEDATLIEVALQGQLVNLVAINREN